MNLRRYALLRAELQRTQDLVLGQLLDPHAAAELHLLLLAAEGGAAAGAAELLCCDAYRVAELTEALGLAIASPRRLKLHARRAVSPLSPSSCRPGASCSDSDSGGRGGCGVLNLFPGQSWAVEAESPQPSLHGPSQDRPSPRRSTPGLTEAASRPADHFAAPSFSGGTCSSPLCVPQATAKSSYAPSASASFKTSSRDAAAGDGQPVAAAGSQAAHGPRGSKLPSLRASTSVPALPGTPAAVRANSAAASAALNEAASAALATAASVVMDGAAGRQPRRGPSDASPAARKNRRAWLSHHSNEDETETNVNQAATCTSLMMPLMQSVPTAAAAEAASANAVRLRRDERSRSFWAYELPPFGGPIALIAHEAERLVIEVLYTCASLDGLAATLAQLRGALTESSHPALCSALTSVGLRCVGGLSRPLAARATCFLQHTPPRPPIPSHALPAAAFCGLDGCSGTGAVTLPVHVRAELLVIYISKLTFRYIFPSGMSRAAPRARRASPPRRGTTCMPCFLL
jgi:hypothetical protein